MKYIPVELNDNVNVSKNHAIAELAWLLGGVTLLLLLGYLVLGWCSELAVQRIPIKAEVWLGELALNRFDEQESAALRSRLEPLLQALPADAPLYQYPFHVHLVVGDTVNAVALPGGHILVFSGLLSEVASENELAMILAHELGHYAHRDHLKGLGRGFGITFVTSLIFGQNSSITGLVGELVMSFESRYSQAQEAAADAYALDLLVARYGHAGGAVDFFTRLAKETGNRWAYLLASHPHPQDRIDKLNNLMAAKGYPQDGVLPLGEDLRESPSTAVEEE
jgi:predicted Zn-dependent protease